MSHNGLDYGFRYDPTQWLKTDTSLFAAFVRTQILTQPNDGDKAILDTVINKILAKQQPDGSLGQDSKETGSKLLDLLELGIDHDSPQVKKAAEAIIHQIQTNPDSDEGEGWEQNVLSIDAINALWRLDKRDLPGVIYSLKWLLDNQDKWNDPWEGCPWTPEVFFSSLWTVRDFPGALEAVQKGLQRVLDQMNEVGSCAYNDPWGFVDAASRIDMPEARELIKREIPMILRNQRPGGHWRHRSPEVFRSLMRHGFFDDLLNLPPLPPDWDIVREIPLPEGKWVSLTWDGKCIWSLNCESNEVVAFELSNGKITRRVSLDNCDHIAWHDGYLITVSNEPKILQKVDPNTSKIMQTRPIDFIEEVCDCEVIDSKVVIGDGFECNIVAIDLYEEDFRDGQVLAGPGPEYLAIQDNTLWHIDFWSHCLIRTGPRGCLLDWGEKPVWNATGLAFDGEHLWVLDSEARRLCAIEKAHHHIN